MKIQKKNSFGGGGIPLGGWMGGSGSGWGGQSGCERRIEVFVKIQKKIIFFWGGGGRWGVGVGGQSGCERRIEVFVKIQKKKLGGGSGGGGWGVGVGLGVRVDVNEELKFL